MVKRYPKLEHDHFAVTIPKTVVICTDIFDEFMETNELYPVALGDADDETILRYFLRASLPPRLIEDLMAFLRCGEKPDRRAFLQPAGRFALSTFRRDLFYVYGT